MEQVTFICTAVDEPNALFTAGRTYSGPRVGQGVQVTDDRGDVQTLTDEPETAFFLWSVGHSLFRLNRYAWFTRKTP